jgi:N-acetylmuramoyl-L-alanine amidase
MRIHTHTVLLSSLLMVAGLLHASPLLVMIDPGHGGRDRGTVKNGNDEADITLAVSRRLRDLMKRDRRFETFLTRSEDSSLSLYGRARLTKDRKAEVFLSIHVNSSPEPRAKGAEFYFQNQLPPDQESMFLAHKENIAEEGESVQPLTYDFLDANPYPNEVNTIVADLLDGDRVRLSSELSKAMKLNWRGTRKSKSNSVRQAPFYVLNQMRAPSTLVELGFLTNSDDYLLLTNANAQQRMAEDLYHGLIAYKEFMDKSNPIP